MRAHWQGNTAVSSLSPGKMQRIVYNKAQLSPIIPSRKWPRIAAKTHSDGIQSGLPRNLRTNRPSCER